MAPAADCLSSITVICRNPQLLKVMLASGLQAAASSVAISFVTTDLKDKYWGQEFSTIQARYAMAMSIVGILGGSVYGRFSDSIDRRVAAAIYGLLTFLPAWTYLALGLTRTALTVSTILQVVACIGVGSNVLLVFSQDLAKPEEHEAAFGAFYLVNSLVTFVCMGIPVLLILVLKVVPSKPHICLLYQVALSAGFFICIALVKMPPRAEVHKQEVASSDEEREGALRGQKGPDSSCGSLLRALWKPIRNLFEPLRLGCGDRDIRDACWAAGLIAFSGDLVMDIGGQYFQDSLGILPVKPGQHPTKKEMTFAVLTMLPPQLGIIPGYALVGWFMKRLGSKRLLQILIPVSWLLTSSGALFQFMADDYTLAVMVVLLDYSSLANVPLFAFVQEAAPRGRVGEAMGAVGSCQQISQFMGNFVLQFMNPMLRRSLGEKGFWVYYPVCGFLTLLALFPVRLMQAASEKEAVTDSGTGESTDDGAEDSTTDSA